jgi:2-amino-4-hydroxy-6-hydroxymethyldihydropteridine diphosphokinase
MPTFTLLLGGNIGEVARTFDAATDLIGQHVGRVVARSRDHRTEPWGIHGVPEFLNRALEVHTDETPSAVMRKLLAVESTMGRQRSGDRYASRTLDIDILFVDDRLLQLPELTVPHPRVHQRAFALAPVADISPALRHPVLGLTIMELLDQVVP